MPSRPRFQTSIVMYEWPHAPVSTVDACSISAQYKAGVVSHHMDGKHVS